jgi:excisionase family DNA binding protein
MLSTRGLKAASPRGPVTERLPMSTEQPSVMTVDEVAEYLRIPRASVYKLAQQGRIPCQKVGRHWRFRRKTVEQWLDAREVDQPDST